jgi:hypothetical protein
MKIRAPALFAATLLGLATTPALSGPDGQKLDSGLGDLPHYSKWVDKTGKDPLGRRVIGESLDDGLGELPHYSKWLDKTGKDPMLTAARREVVASR